MHAVAADMPLLSSSSSSPPSSPSWEDRRHQFCHNNKQLNRDRYFRRYHFCRTSILILFSSLFIITKSYTRCRAFVMSPCHSRGNRLIHKRKVFSFTNRNRKRTFFQSSMSNQASPDSTESEEEEESVEHHPRNDDDKHSGSCNEDDEISREKDDTDKSKKQLSTVYEDLEKLEKAITLENADLKLKQFKMKEQIDFIDQSKRPIVPDALKYIIIPLIYALLLSILLSSKVVKIRMIARSITKVMDFHFWIFVVWVPLIFNAFKRIRQPRPDPIPDQIKNLDPAHASIFLSPLSTELGGWEDPDTSCTDYVLFLSEYWTSAVNGIAWIIFLKTILIKSLTGINAAKSLTTVIQSSSWVVLWLSCSQLLTRMGAVASLYQYPEKMYELERSSLTRPVGLFPIVMWKIVRAMLILAPLGFISDFAKVLSHLPKGSIYPLFGSIAVYMLGTWTRMEASSSKDPLNNHLLKPPKSTSKLLYLLCYSILGRKQIRLLKLGKMMQNLWTTMWSSYTPFFWKSVGIGYLANLSLLGPIIHLKAISKIFQIEYTNDLPILSTGESYNQILDEHPERYYNMAWRYSLRWRDPERLTISKGNLYTYLFYLYFFKGSAQEQYTTLFQKTNFRRLEDGKTIADRLRREKEEKSLGENELPDGDRDEWKSRASKFQAEKHRKEYETKKYDDPLGVAVYKGFGVGIGYNFDHQSELKEGKQPSVRRLQARAAKSAVRRHIELTEKEKQIEELNETLDPKDRDDHDRRIQRMKKKIDDEILYLGNRLIELVPVGRGDLDEFGYLNTTKFERKSEASYRRISSHEYRKLEEDPLARTRNSGNETNKNHEEIILSGLDNVNNTVSENKAEEKDGQKKKKIDVDFETEDNDNIDSNISSSSDDIGDDDDGDENNGTSGLLDIVNC